MNGWALASRAAASIRRGWALRAQGDVLPDRRREQERVLEHHADLGRERGQGIVADVAAIDPDPPVGRVVEPEDQAGECGLADPGGPDQGDVLARLDPERRSGSSTRRPGSYSKSTASNANAPRNGGAARRREGRGPPASARGDGSRAHRRPSP